MNYRHAFHAGNFADVFKHIILARCLEHLKAKPTPFRVIDTHAGIGRYDLSGVRAERTGEWRAGIGRLLEASLPDGIKALIQALSGCHSGNPRRSWTKFLPWISRNRPFSNAR